MKIFRLFFALILLATLPSFTTAQNGHIDTTNISNPLNLTVAGAGTDKPVSKEGEKAPGIEHRNILRSPIAGISNSNKQGKVVLEICVDRDGKVISAEYTSKGSTTSDKELIDLALENVKKWKFSPGEPEKQCGTITYNFKSQ